MNGRRWAAFLVMVASVLLLSSCTANSPTSAPAASETGPSGELTVALPDFHASKLDPILGGASMSWTVTMQIFDSLVMAARDGKLVPGVADKWEMAADGLSWTFYLHPGIRFHNGDPLTAADVKFSIERFLSPQSITTYAGTLRSAVKSVDVIDDNTVRVNTNGTVLSFPQMMSPLGASEGQVMPKKYLEEKGAEYFVNNPIGSGPYKFVEQVVGDHITYEAVDKHWRQTASFKRLNLLSIPEAATRVAMLKTGKADIAAISQSSLREVEGAGFRIESIPYSMQIAIWMMGNYLPEAGPLGNLKVRQALSLALNRDEIITSVLGGKAQASYPWQIFPYSADVDLAQWKDNPYTKYDPDRAKQLLTEAGFPKGFNIKLWQYQLAATPFYNDLGVAVAGYWEKIGLSVSIEPIDYAAWRSLWTKNDPKIAGTASLNRLMSGYVIPGGMKSYDAYRGGLLRASNIPELDDLIDAAPKERDDAKRKEIIAKAVRMSNDNYAFLPVAYVDAVYGVSKKVGEWTAVAGHPDLAIVYPTLKQVK